MTIQLGVDCEEVEDKLSVDEIVSINRRITEPGDPEQNRIGFDSPEFERGREEDYHYLRNPGILETLVHTKLFHECRNRNDLLWLTSHIITHIAQNQAFSEGNKRTAYITGVLFLVRIQLEHGEEAQYPLLDRKMTDKLQKLAVKDINCEQFYSYLEEKLG